MPRARSNVRTIGKSKRQYVYSGYVRKDKRQAQQKAAEFRKQGFYATIIPIQYKKEKYYQVFYSVKENNDWEDAKKLQRKMVMKYNKPK